LRHQQRLSIEETEMFTHPELIMDLARDRQRELIAEAERWRLLAAARQHRSDLRRGGGPTPRAAARGRPTTRVAAAH
jgi:hypothetical protein